MNKEEFIKILNNKKKDIDERVRSYFPKKGLINETMTYAADGGKRIRASLYLESKKMFSSSLSEEDYKMALAIELIHAYSLVHDDLPAMDNDDYRRGMESLHKKYGEDLAILTGDALLNEAAIILFDVAIINNTYLKSSKYIMERASKRGMIQGQILDLRKDIKVDKSYLLEVYSKKTSDLFKAACIGAALSAKASHRQIELLSLYAENLGLAFQIQDDLLEDTYDDELNILNIMTKEEAINLLDSINKDARDAISNFSHNEFLTYLIDYLSKRSY
ncbi:polyprenyl synthetase family protein [Anaerococcus sp. NML200537]|uniref:polyprenyl synthetase family protein n=1 Tax=Anaerococcus sp. NML200537 TaxID=2954485 RepID=UPI002237C2CA|nr:polyprenyl synthetase family protein [Anaerococcus sp. NML200537]MCW6701608.1 polyprenyl synthetase family protein [Anaerococcus sp. NML200537]